MKTEYIIFGVIGVAVLFFVMRARGQVQPQVVPEFIPPQNEAQASASEPSDEVKLGAFGALASLAQTKIQTGAQLDATKIAADIQRAGIEANEALGLRQIQAQEDLFFADLGNRAATERMHLDAVERTINSTRGLSTSSVGVLLNAVGSVFNKQPTYNYVSAFGPKSEPWYAPITKGIGAGLGGLIGGIPAAIKGGK